MKHLKTIFSRVLRLRYSGAIALTFIIAIQTIFITNIFFDQKVSYHCDEIYSYGLANNYYQPYLEGGDVYDSSYENINEWVSGELYHNYLTVQPDQRFRYDSVWYNQSLDRHPPLYYVCIHTICSFFPDSFSFVYGFVLNLVCFAVTQIFLYLLNKRLLRSQWAALLACCVWGCSIGNVNLTLFVRMYSMLTMFVVMMLYFHVKLIAEDRSNKAKWKLLLPLYVVTLAGSMTQYLFLVAAFLIAVCFCLRYLIQRRWLDFLRYGCTMLGSVLTFFLIYPPAIRQMLAENGKEHTNFWFQLESAMRSLLNNTIGMGFSDIVWWLHMLPLMLLLIAAFMLPIMYLFRQSAPIKKMVQRVKAMPTGIKKWQLRSFSMWLKRVDPMTIFMLLIVLAVMVLIADKIPFYFGYAVRYLYMVMPLMITVMISCLYWLVKRFKAGKLLLTLFCLCPIVTNLCGMTLPPYMTYQNTLSMSTVLRGNNVVVLTYDRTNYDQYSPYAYELCETDHVFFTSLEDYDVYIDAINTMPSDEELDVLIYYVDTKEDERGRYIIGDLVAGKNGERRKIYCEDILSRFQAQGQPEYVGEYHFVEGSFLTYRFS